MHDVRGVVETDDIGYADQGFLRMAGITGGEVIEQSHAFAS
ncbi:hypothetical protein AB3G40_07040 [Mycobacterium kansasii]|uniref:Uncharacterized protein n=1 Tax=Mycobacterium kansasii ATCC 12478 TaxID=557599 RepID=U5WZ06_MYCKA|nr:hypothetical protein [Mycobacterium kansasii]AGZ54374.1 hypothetical protein MKAN_21400 [Mycobacterium kansasii ATCC 12478]